MPRGHQTRKLIGVWLLLFACEPPQIVFARFSQRENQRDEMLKENPEALSGSWWRKDELLRSPEGNALSVEGAEREARSSVGKPQTHHLAHKVLQLPRAFEAVDAPFQMFSKRVLPTLVSNKIGRVDGVHHRLIRTDRP